MLYLKKRRVSYSFNSKTAEPFWSENWWGFFTQAFRFTLRRGVICIYCCTGGKTTGLN